MSQMLDKWIDRWDNIKVNLDFFDELRKFSIYLRREAVPNAWKHWEKRRAASCLWAVALDSRPNWNRSLLILQYYNTLVSIIDIIIYILDIDILILIYSTSTKLQQTTIKIKNFCTLLFKFCWLLTTLIKLLSLYRYININNVVVE